VDSVTSGLFQIGIHSVRLNTRELAELYYNFNNPDTAVREPLVDFSRLATMYVKKGEKPQIDMQPEMYGDIVAPVRSGDVVGIMNYYMDGNKIGEIDIIYNEDIDKIRFSELFMQMVRLWTCGGVDRT
jgi:hypothetical protein